MGFLSNYKFVMGHQTSQIQFVHRKFNVKYARWGIASLVALLRFYVYCTCCLIYTTLCFCRGIGFTWFAFETSFFI